MFSPGEQTASGSGPKTSVIANEWLMSDNAAYVQSRGALRKASLLLLLPLSMAVQMILDPVTLTRSVLKTNHIQDFDDTRL